ncbi:MAG: hypothetical protein ACKVQU_25350 [Burkholderiales bacterium]
MLAYSYTDLLVKGMQAARCGLSAESFGRAVQAIPHDDFITLSPSRFTANHLGLERARVEQLKGGRWVSVSTLLTEIVK